MTAQQQHFGVSADVDESRRHETDAGTKRLAAFFMVLSALLLVALTWFANEVNTTHASSGPAPGAAAQTSREFEYFPSNYVNQATEIEEHIEAF